MTELKIKNGIMKSVFITFDQAFYERILALLDRQNCRDSVIGSSCRGAAL